MMAAANTSVLTVHGLHFSWPGVPLFQNLNLLIPAGVSVVCGEESSGKTKPLA
jgi:ABC-type cobalamin/Fe3+-siderophores transport system ATPase subunit